MIDPRLLRDDPELIRASQRVRGESTEVVDALLRADEQRAGHRTVYTVLGHRNSDFVAHIKAGKSATRFLGA